MPSSTFSELKSKARKLLALASDPSAPPGEAQNAREAAYRLMREAAVSEADLRAEDRPEFAVREFRLPRVASPAWAAIAVHVASLTSVSVYTRSEGRDRVCILVGTADQTESVHAMWQAAKDQAQGSSPDYVRGYLVGIQDVVRRAKRAVHSTELVRMEREAKEWFESGRKVTQGRPLPRMKPSPESMRGFRDGGHVALEGKPTLTGVETSGI